ncbi:MAG: hypothetical protein JNJ61_20180, partial [Anaerolineae bacterium]|nr:hypothetical protein [Anaerolineae bacterium]
MGTMIDAAEQIGNHASSFNRDHHPDSKSLAFRVDRFPFTMLLSYFTTDFGVYELMYSRQAWLILFFVFTIFIVITYPTLALPPIAPPLQSPLDAIMMTDHTPSFSWSGVTTATTYEIQVSDSADFGNILRTASGAFLGYTVPNPLPLLDGLYYWRVRGQNVDGYGEWSEIRNFIIYTLAPPLGSPADGTATTDHTPSFSWSGVADGVTYEIQISDSSTFATILQTVSGSFVGYIVPNGSPLPDGVYYWRVRTRTIAGDGPWSVIRRVTVYTLAPLLGSPADGDIMTDHTPSVSWSGVSDGTTYEIQISDTSTFTTILRTVSGFFTGYTVPNGNPLPDGVYYWRVRTRTIAGDGPWSVMRSFTVHTLAPPLGSPADGATTTDTTPSFSWSGVSDGTTYEIQISDTSTF